MIAEFLITFRESLEVALIVGIILTYLAKTKQQKFNNVVYIGIAAGIAGSIIAALIFQLVAGGFSGKAEEIFEGITMIMGAILLTTMILWMMKQKHVAKEIEQKVAAQVDGARKMGLFSLVFFSVLREGVETVIFLAAASFAGKGPGLVGASLGVVVAVVLGYLLFVASMRVNIKMFFNVSSILLILFAAGLMAHGVHEFAEAGLIPPIVDPVFDINPADLTPDVSYPLMHESGTIGSILKGLFGYNGNPTLIELIAYFAYLVLVFFLYKKIESSHSKA